MDMPKAVIELRTYSKQLELKEVQEIKDDRQKRILGVLAQRQMEGLRILECVQAREEVSQEKGRQKPGIDQLIRSPVLSLALLTMALVSGVIVVASGASGAAAGNTQWSLILICSVLLAAGQAIYQLVKGKEKKDPAAVRPKPELVIDQDKARMLLDRQCRNHLADSQAICEMFTAEYEENVGNFEADLLRLYPSLYEASVDHPEVEDLRFGITLVKMMLRKCGLEAVPYSEERKNLFNVEEADYQDQMRYPAIVRAQTGELMKKGEYIRNIRK